MKNINRLTAFLLAFVLLISLLIPVVAAEQPSSYSAVRNSGERDVACTTLDGTGADDYYTGSYTYEALSELSSGALLTTLRTLMKTTHKKQTSYSDCRDYADETDCENGNSTIITLYTSYASSQSEYNGGNGWNREHVWPKSLGGFNTSGAGADLHHIRPTENKTNSNRGNLKYGEVSGGSKTTGNLSGLVGGSYGSYFEPLDNVKGDVARICLYVYVRYGGELSKCNSITNVFQSVDVLLAWCELDPVDTWEMGRNEVVQNIQGNRNVFIDYPELAWQLFGKTAPADMSTPSGAASDDSSSGDETCKHTATAVKNAVSATCGKDGYTGDTYCAACNEKISAGISIPKTENHEWGDPIITVAPTATSGGEQEQVCEVCGEIKISAIPKLEDVADQNPDSGDEICAHSVTVVKNSVAATCSENGYSGDTYCASCDELISEGRIIAATDKHEWSGYEIVTPPTENETGKAKETCSACGEERTVEVDKLDPTVPDSPPETDITSDKYSDKIIIAIIEGMLYSLFVEALS